MAEKEQAFRHRLLEKTTNESIFSHNFGQGLGFVVCLCLVAGAIYLGSLGQQAVPGMLLGVSATGMVALFVNSAKGKNGSDGEDKAAPTPPQTPQLPKKPAAGKAPAKSRRRK